MDEQKNINERCSAIYLFDFKARHYTLVTCSDLYFSTHYGNTGSLGSLYLQEFDRTSVSMNRLAEQIQTADELTLLNHHASAHWKQAIVKRIPNDHQVLVYLYQDMIPQDSTIISPKKRFDLYFKALYREAFAMSECDLSEDLLYEMDFNDHRYEHYFYKSAPSFPVKASQAIKEFALAHVEFDQEGFLSFFSKDFIYSLYRRGRSSAVYNFVIHEGGEALYIEVSHAFSLNQQGHMIVLSVFKDVSKRYEKQEERLRYLHLLKNLTQDYQCVLLCGLDRKTEIYRLEPMYKKAIVNGQDIMQVFKNYAQKKVCQEDQQDFLSHLDVDTILKSKSVNNRFRFRVNKASGQEYHEVHIIKMGDAQNPLIAFGFTNVDADQRRKLKTQHLLKAALDQAENANVAKGTFLSNMSHDMRTPMNAIMGFTEIALSNLEDQEVLKYSLSRIMEASKSLLSIIDNALNVTRIESGRVHLHQKTFLLSQVLNDLERELRPLVQERRQSFKRVDHFTHDALFMDVTKLKAILNNILMNAIKYTPANGHIHFTIEEEAADEPYTHFIFTIEDDGIGMSANYLKNIYDPFSREENTTNSGVAGTGLGMTIAKNLIDMAGGHIDITSTPQVGTKVVVTLDFKYMQSMTQLPKRKEEIVDLSCLKGKRILIVEDNSLNAEITRTILSSVGVETTVVGNGKLAIEAIMQQNFDVVLMDIMMPVMDGYATSEAIRSFSDVPIIAMSANAFDEDKRKAYAAGMNDYITKPFKTNHLLQVIALWSK